MSNPKREARIALESLPDDATFEEIQYTIYVRQKIAQGLESAENARVVSHDEAKRRMAQWLAK